MPKTIKSFPLGHILKGECPDCGADMVLRNSKYGLFYGCSRYPKCESAHGAHKETGQPLGTPANKETKEWRIKAHDAFDRIWQQGPTKVLSRRKAYKELANRLEIPYNEMHIGMFDIEMCKRMIAESEAYLVSVEPLPEWQKKAQETFDRLWSGESCLMRRKAAVTLLRGKLELSKGQFEIEKFNIYQCRRTVEETDRIFNEQKIAEIS